MDNPVPLSPILNRKRKMSTQDEGGIGTKSAKLDSTQEDPVLKEIRQGFSASNEAMNGIKSQLESFNKAHLELAAEVSAEKVKTTRLEGEMAELKTSLPNDIKQGIAEYFEQNPIDSSNHKADTIRDIERADKQILIFGAKSPFTKDSFQAVLDNANIEASVMDLRALTSRKGPNQPPFYKASLGSVFQRNAILRNSSQLGGLRVERDMPIAFKDAHNRFKRDAYALCSTLGVSTSIIFVGHKLILRYKQQGANMAYTIFKEFSPPPSIVSKGQEGNSVPPGLLPSRNVTKEVIADIQRSVFLPPSDLSLADLKAKISVFLGGFEARGLIELRKNSKNISILCNSQETASSICKALSKGSQDNYEFKPQIFDL